MSLLATRNMPSTSAPGDGSRTIITEDAQPRPEDESSDIPDQTSTLGTLRLRGGPRRVRRHIAWGEDVIDNEGYGRKSSKICCIYHKPKRFDESSDEDSSESDSDSACDDDSPSHSHSHGHRRRRDAPRGDRGQAETRGDQGAGVVCQLEDDPESNAYEMMPSSKKGKRKGG